MAYVGNPQFAPKPPQGKSSAPVTIEGVWEQGFDSPQLQKLATLASPMPWTAKVFRIEDPFQLNRIDILDANNELVCHFHQLGSSPDVDTKNWENNARFMIQLTHLLNWKEKQNGNRLG